MYLVDTNVISTAAPSRSEADRAVAAWIADNSARLYLPVVTVAEIVSGIARLRRQGSRRRAEALDLWLEAVLHLYAARILPLDLPAARLTGALADSAVGKGHAPAFADVSIAAIAAVRGLTVLTRNVRHFAPLGVPVLDPFDTLPPSGTG